MIFLSDIDGCALDWMHGFKTFVLRNGIAVKDHDPKEWDLGGWFKEPQDIDKLVRLFNSSIAFGHLPAFDDAIKVLPMIRAISRKVIAITSCANDEVTTERREKNLREHFGNTFDEVVCLPLGVSKRDSLSKYTNAFWVEDKTSNAVLGAELGHTTFLITRPHNVNDGTPDCVIRVGGWMEIYERIRLGFV